VMNDARGLPLATTLEAAFDAAAVIVTVAGLEAAARRSGRVMLMT
jgi:hypothetical protein